MPVPKALGGGSSVGKVSSPARKHRRGHIQRRLLVGSHEGRSVGALVDVEIDEERLLDLGRRRADLEQDVLAVALDDGEAARRQVVLQGLVAGQGRAVGRRERGRRQELEVLRARRGRQRVHLRIPAMTKARVLRSGRDLQRP